VRELDMNNIRLNLNKYKNFRNTLKSNFALMFLVFVGVCTFLFFNYRSSEPIVEYNGDIIIYPSSFKVTGTTEELETMYCLYRISFDDNGNFQEVAVIRKHTGFGGILGRKVIYRDGPDFGRQMIGTFERLEGNKYFHFPELSIESRPYSILIKKMSFINNEIGFEEEGLWYEFKKVNYQDQITSLIIPNISDLKPLNKDLSKSIDNFRSIMKSKIDTKLHNPSDILINYH
jgi:hypothetical protein